MPRLCGLSFAGNAARARYAEGSMWVSGFDRGGEARNESMQADLSAVVTAILERHDVGSEAMERAIGAVMDGSCEPAEIGSLLTALRLAGETSEQIVGAARAMRERAVRIRPQATDLVDTCGTGGDGSKTFNISTATAMVAAAAGIHVAKHGNRSVSSLSGSADVLEALGVAIDLPPDAVARCIDETGIGFCFAPLIHGAMKHAAPIRRQLGFRTIFNLLGPLTNPAGASRQLLGTPNDATAQLLAEALFQLGTQRSLVLCGNGETDELCLWGSNRVFEVTEAEITEHRWTHADFGLPACERSRLVVEDAAESAGMIRAIFAGEPGPPRDTVVANAAAVLWLCGRQSSLEQAARAVERLIDDGQAARKTAELAAWTQRTSSPEGS